MHTAGWSNTRNFRATPTWEEKEEVEEEDARERKREGERERGEKERLPNDSLTNKTNKR